MRKRDIELDFINLFQFDNFICFVHLEYNISDFQLLINIVKQFFPLK
jgi:hypothetical protein